MHRGTGRPLTASETAQARTAGRSAIAIRTAPHPVSRTAATRPGAATRRPAPARRVPPTASRSARPLAFAAGAAAATGLVLAVAALAGFAALRASPRILPGVTVLGLPLEGQDVEQAAALLDRFWNHEMRLAAVDTQDPQRAWTVTPAEVGLVVDAAASAAAAHAVGRGPGLPAALDQLAGLLTGGVDVRPRVLFDPVAARAGLLALAPRTTLPPVDAVIRIEAGRVQHAPGVPGRTLDADRTLELLASDPSGALLDYGFLPLVMQPVAPRLADAGDAAAEAERLLAAPPTLQAFDPVTGERFAWTPAPEQMAAWLAFEADGPAYRVRVDSAALEAYAIALGGGLGADRFLPPAAARDALLEALQGGSPAPVRVGYNPGSYVVGARDTLVSIGVRYGFPYWVIVEANPHLRTRGLTPGETLVIPPPDANLRLPVVPHKRIVISIAEQRMWVYENGEVVREFVVSTGIARSPTLPGVFQVQTHVLNAYASIWDLYMPHFMGIYEAVPGFWNGIHGLPLLSNRVRLWADVLGRPASYGCIILDLPSAEWLYGWAEEGVVVEIRR